jgi:photosystem II stability/assembly factor-like uncharacterized protein
MKKITAVRDALLVVLSFTILSSSFALASSEWKPIGPEGGDARAFAADPTNPSHLYLGTVSGWMYDSTDDGAHWQQLAQVVADRDDLVLDNILVDPLHPSTLLVGAWVLGSPDGGLFESSDSGHTWHAVTAMKGQSIRALTRSVSDPNTIVAGTLLGVFRSTDDGQKWSRISPPENAEIHEVESIAIDPKDPNIIYAGTWHLPWKTMNGGKTWQNVKQGLIDDSDVFSIILDPVTPSTVYLSACSGIYKSTDAAMQFTKVQGIPSTARRTRVLMQDPANRNIVYAGTTEGLYKTVDAGHAWVRMTSPDVIINDINIDPRDPNRVLLATDRSGVLSSTNAGVSFGDSNRGFYQRQVSTMAVDPTNPKKVYVGVLNDKTYGGVFATDDSGATWSQRGIGLAGRDVYSLVALPDGDLLAGTNRGLAQWSGSGPWGPAGKMITLVEKKTTVTKRNPHTHKLERETRTTEEAKPAPELTARVGGLAISGNDWFAASTAGLFRSTDKGATWVGGPVLDQSDFRFVSAQGDIVFAAESNRLFVSTNDGSTWIPGLMPNQLSHITALLVSPDGVLWIAGPEGVWTSHDKGASFQKNSTLPIDDISSVTWDNGLQRVLVTSRESKLMFGSKDDGASWKYWSVGWPLRTAASADGHVYGASLFHSVVMGDETAAR